MPSSKRSLTAALTRRCWSIRERPSNWAALTVARRCSPPPSSSMTSTAAPGSAASIIAFSSARSTATSLSRPIFSPSGVEHLLDPDELDPRAAVGLAAADLGLVDRLPVLEADVADAALGEQLLDRGGLRVRRARAASADSTSASRCVTVSSASFLLVPITPEGPRLIQPAV